MAAGSDGRLRPLRHRLVPRPVEQPSRACDELSSSVVTTSLDGQLTLSSAGVSAQIMPAAKPPATISGMASYGDTPFIWRPDGRQQLVLVPHTTAPSAPML